MFIRATGDPGLGCKTGMGPIIQWMRGIEVEREKEMSDRGDGDFQKELK